MHDILETILATKRAELSALTSERRTEILAVADGGPPLRGFGAALRRRSGEPIRAIAEIKRASPSAGPIRPGADPASIGRDYAAAGATAISVLTDRSYFDGDLAFLAQVRAAVSLPLLRKDFVIDPIQVAEARLAGADAVLLIVAAFDPPPHSLVGSAAHPGGVPRQGFPRVTGGIARGSSALAECMAMAARVGLDALVEVHSEDELATALDVGATLIGVNHRDLRTFSIDMSLTERIAKRCQGRDDIVLVGESGIRTRADVQRLADAGAHAVLVGEQLMRSPSPGAALAELLA